MRESHGAKYSFVNKSTQGCQRLQGFLPQLDEFYFTTTEKKIGKIAGGLFRISRMTNSFKLNKNHVVSTVPTIKYRTLKTFQIS